MGTERQETAVDCTQSAQEVCWSFSAAMDDLRGAIADLDRERAERNFEVAWQYMAAASGWVATPRQWVALTDDDRDAAFNSMPNMLDGFMKLWGWLHFAKAIEQKVREKNTHLSTERYEPVGGFLFDSGRWSKASPEFASDPDVVTLYRKVHGSGGTK